MAIVTHFKQNNQFADFRNSGSVRFMVILFRLRYCDPGSESSTKKRYSTALPRAPWNATNTDLLKRSLLAGYDKFARPAHHLISTNVSLGVTFNHVDLDDISAVMTVHGWIRMQWYDEKLRWNSSDYGGLKNLHLADHEIWQPDIVQYNSASGNTVDQYGNTHCIVSEQGSVLWVPPSKLTTFCNIDLTRWPEDRHTCFYVFGSWTYDGGQINLDGDSATSDTDNYIDNPEWELVSISHEKYTKYYACCEEAPYHSIEFSVVIQRRGGSRALILRLQATVAVFLALLTHWFSPTESAPRALLSAAPPAIITLALFYFAQRLPTTPHSPNIVVLYSCCLYICCVSIVVSVCVLNLCRSRRAIPWAVRRVLASKPLCCLVPEDLTHYECSTSEELQSAGGSVLCPESSTATGLDSSTRGNSFKSAPTAACLTLAILIDRIAFILLLIIFLLVLFIYGF